MTARRRRTPVVNERVTLRQQECIGWLVDFELSDVCVCGAVAGRHGWTTADCPAAGYDDERPGTKFRLAS